MQPNIQFDSFLVVRCALCYLRMRHIYEPRTSCAVCQYNPHGISIYVPTRNLQHISLPNYLISQQPTTLVVNGTSGPGSTSVLDNAS